jgi:calcineurin-like phosphoesterase family protein
MVTQFGANLQDDPGWYDVFRTVNSIGMTTINGQKVMLSHFPYQGEGNRDLEERYPEWRLRNVGLPLLHGHTHSKSRIGSVKNRSVHVGVDAWNWGPVSESEVWGTLETIEHARLTRPDYEEES